MTVDKVIGECVSTPECTLYSEVLKLDWNYSIYLPRGYDLEENSGKEYPVIYFLHGAYGNHRNFVERIHMNRMLERLAEGRDRIAKRTGDGEKAAPEFAPDFPDVIGVFADGFNTFYIDGPALAMESAVIKDLIPKIERMYRVKKDRNSRMICGISMGGFGSARFALKYPELFATCAVISPAVSRCPGDDNLLKKFWHVFKDDKGNFSQEVYDRENPEAFFGSYEKKKNPVAFYVATGDADTVVPVDDVRSFAKRLGAIAQVEYRETPGMGHTWPFWRDAFRDVFDSETLKNFRESGKRA